MNKLNLTPLLLMASIAPSFAMCPSQEMEEISLMHHGKKIVMSCTDGVIYGIHSVHGRDEQTDTAVCRENGIIVHLG